MASPLDKQGSSKTSKQFDHKAADGTRLDAGPFIGIVKSNTDILRSGRLQVWIPELGGAPDDDRSWRNVSYSTPFYGVTPHTSDGDYTNAPHSYGMWFVPPDIGVKVICIFVNGDPARGYWIGCVPDWPSMGMVPGLSANPSDTNIPSPVVELYVNPSDKNDAAKLQDFSKQPRKVHAVQEAIWSKQGILKDADRGPGTSSAFRETPSSVFGISTPGKPINPNDPDYFNDPITGTTVYGSSGRKGGHTLVMDDGDYKGNNAMLRFRTSGGHMIMMNDTKDFIYVINSKGTAWVELTSQGDINVYGESTMNITAKAGFNLETDGGIMMHAKKDINIKSDTNVNIEGKDLNLKGSGSTKVTGAMSLHLKGKSTYLTGDTCLQFKSNGHLDARALCITLNTAGATAAMEAGSAQAPQNMPTHEPFKRATPQSGAVPNPTAQPSYGSQQGQSTSSGPYGATNNYGGQNNPNTPPPTYGPMTNDVPPTTYTSAPQGNFLGQGDPISQYIPSNVSPIAVAANFATRSVLQNLTFGSGSAIDIGNNVQGQFTNQNYSAGELQNNPGNLQYSSSDKFAVGFANGLAVYSKPEDGIAALMSLFDSYATNSPIAAIQLIANYLQSNNLTDSAVINFMRFITNNSGIKSTDYVSLHDPQTRITWATVVITQIQGRMLYSYQQVVTGCAESLGLSPSTFAQNLTPNVPWNNSSSPSGFVSPNNPALQQGGGSLLGSVAQNIGNGLINRAIGAVGNAVGDIVNNALRGGIAPSSGDGGGSFGFVGVDTTQASSRQDAERLLNQGGSFVDASNKVDAANPAAVNGGVPFPIARPMTPDLVGFGQDPASILAAEKAGTLAQDASLAPQRLSNPLQLLAADQKVSQQQSVVNSATQNLREATTNSYDALQQYGPNSKEYAMAQASEQSARNALSQSQDQLNTLQSERDTIVATSPLLDKQDGQPNSSAADDLRAKQDAYYGAVSTGDPAPSDNTTNGQLGRGLPDSYGMLNRGIPSTGDTTINYSNGNYTNQNQNPQIPGFQQITYQNTGQTVYVGKDSSGNSVVIQASTINDLTKSGLSPSDIASNYTPEGLKSIENYSATASVTASAVPDAVPDYRAPAQTNVPTNSPNGDQRDAAFTADYNSATQSRDVDHTGDGTANNTVTQPQDGPTPSALQQIQSSPDTTYNSQTLNAAVGNNPTINGVVTDPRPGEGTLGGGYADPAPKSAPTTDTSYLYTKSSDQQPVTGTTPAPGSGGISGGSGTPQGSAATGPSAGSC